jgi:hypothetical protein
MARGNDGARKGEADLGALVEGAFGAVGAVLPEGAPPLPVGAFPP